MLRRNYHPLPQDNISTMQSAGTPVLFHSIFGAPAIIMLAQWSEAIGPRPRPGRSCTPHGSMIDSVLLRASATPAPSSFPLFLRSWKPQVRTSILTCCIATGPIRPPSFPRSKVSRVRLRKCPPRETDRVYPHWPVSFLAAHGTVRYNDRARKEDC
jgi:hypothetical protein